LKKNKVEAYTKTRKAIEDYTKLVSDWKKKQAIKHAEEAKKEKALEKPAKKNDEKKPTNDKSTDKKKKTDKK